MGIPSSFHEPNRISFRFQLFLINDQTTTELATEDLVRSSLPMAPHTKDNVRGCFLSSTCLWLVTFHVLALHL